ncbi:MAG TPA: creatininase family protein [Chitinispirillaceae bacterium]|nr:creatininase family protein [Chitinispirillaceae bacterium]
MILNNTMRLLDLSFREIEELVKQCPGLIFPLGSLEPFGRTVPIGVPTFCCESIAAAISSRLSVLLAPTFHFGCSTPFWSFTGCTGVKPAVMVNCLLDISKALKIQGFKRILMIDLSSSNQDALIPFLKRVNSKEETVKVFSLHTDKSVRSFLSRSTGVDEPWRQEVVILSLAAYLGYPGLSSDTLSDSEIRADKEAFRRWFRTGKDPQKFRRLFPSGIISSSFIRFSAGLGEDLFGFILELLEKEYTSFLKSSCDDSKTDS